MNERTLPEDKERWLKSMDLTIHQEETIRDVWLELGEKPKNKWMERLESREYKILLSLGLIVIFLANVLANALMDTTPATITFLDSIFSIALSILCGMGIFVIIIAILVRKKDITELEFFLSPGIIIAAFPRDKTGNIIHYLLWMVMTFILVLGGHWTTASLVASSPFLALIHNHFLKKKVLASLKYVEKRPRVIERSTIDPERMRRAMGFLSRSLEMYPKR